MTEECGRADEIDVASYLDDPNDPVWADFHAHAQSCAPCTAAVARVRQVTSLLRSLGSEALEAHPSEEQLGQYIEGRLGQERQAVEDHLKVCRSCAAEMEAVKRLDFAAFSKVVQEGRPVPRAMPAREVKLAERTWFARLLWNPQFAYAVAVLALCLPVMRTVLQPSTNIGHEPPGPAGSQSASTVAEARLAEYKAAYEKRDLARIQAVWSLTPQEVEALQKRFAEPGRLVLLYQILDKPTEAPGRVIVSFLEVASRVLDGTTVESTSTLRAVELTRNEAAGSWTMRSTTPR